MRLLGVCFVLFIELECMRRRRRGAASAVNLITPSTPAAGNQLRLGELGYRPRVQLGARLIARC
jgi:hypothetical protein